jgi:hypothetical protein
VLAVAVLCELLLAQLATGKVDAASWEAYQLRRSCCDHRALDLRLFTARARFHEDRAEDTEAEAAYRKALAAARSLYEEMKYPEDRLCFVDCQQRLVVDARMCLYRCGKKEEVGELEIAPSPRELQDRAHQRARERRNRNGHVAAMLLATFGVPLCLFLWVVQ